MVSLTDDFSSQLLQQFKDTATEAVKELNIVNSYPEYLTIKQAAEFLNCSRSTLERKYIPAGLKVITIGSLRRISKQECIDFYEKFDY